jgi:hypothetical protein
MSTRIRRMRISLGVAQADTKWSRPTLRITEEGKEVVITITDPWELQYLRKQLTAIAEYWKAQVKDL